MHRVSSLLAGHCLLRPQVVRACRMIARPVFRCPFQSVMARNGPVEPRNKESRTLHSIRPVVALWGCLRVSTVWTPLDLLRSGLAFALPSSVSPPPARFSSPAGIAFAPCSSGCRYQLLSPTHGLGFPLSILRFRLGHFPLAAERRFPSSVFGPVESPPCRRHRPLL